MKYLFLLVVTATLFSCELNKVKYDTYTYEDKFQIDAPEFMIQTDDLLAEAPLQFENTSKEMYTLVINEDKGMLESVFFVVPEIDKSKPLIEQYCTMQTISTRDLMEIEEESGPEKATIGGLEARIMEYEGYPEGLDFDTYYYIAIIEGEDAIYKVTSWCMGEDKSVNRPIFKQMAESFKEL